MAQCCICQETGKYVYQFPLVLKDLEIEGTMAHVACVIEAKHKAEKKASRQGIRPTQVNYKTLTCNGL